MPSAAGVVVLAAAAGAAVCAPTRSAPATAPIDIPVDAWVPYFALPEAAVEPGDQRPIAAPGLAVLVFGAGRDDDHRQRNT